MHPPDRRPSATRATVLVVDDEPAIRLLIRTALDDAGYRVLEATDGASALRIAGREQPDLVLLDIVLPSMSGLEVCRRLRDDTLTASTPVILLTGLDREAERRAAAHVGASACIVKPFNVSRLVDHVSSALASAGVVPI